MKRREALSLPPRTAFRVETGCAFTPGMNEFLQVLARDTRTLEVRGGWWKQSNLFPTKPCLGHPPPNAEIFSSPPFPCALPTRPSPYNAMFLRWVSWTSSSVSLNSFKTLEEILSSGFRIIHGVLVDRCATGWASWCCRIGWVEAQSSSTAGRATPIPALARLVSDVGAENQAHRPHRWRRVARACLFVVIVVGSVQSLVFL